MSTTATGRPRQQPAAPQQPADLDAPLLDEVIENTARRIDLAAGQFRDEIEATGNEQLRRSLITAAAMKRLRLALEPLKDLLMGLMNSPLGFMTDRDPSRSRSGTKVEPYGWEVVSRCAVQALLRGFNFVGNEWGIIAGNFYPQKNGWERKCRECPGLTDLDVQPGVPRQDNGLTCVRVGASWKLSGQAMRLTDGEGKPGRVFAIITSSPTTPDTTVGKALAKAYRAIYQRATGSIITGADEPDEAPPPPPADTTPLESELARERQELTEELAEEISAADTGKGLDDLATRVGANRPLLGADLAGALLAEVEERRAALRT